MIFTCAGKNAIQRNSANVGRKQRRWPSSMHYAPLYEAVFVMGRVQQFADVRAISKYAIPEAVAFVESLPKTNVGRLDKKAMRARHADLAGS